MWGIARFADPTRRQALEDAGITTRAVDLGEGDLADVPDDFTYVLHLAWTRADLSQLEASLRTNVEGAGLVLQHCRRAKAALVMSGMGVYSPSPDPWHLYTETDPVGRAATAYAPTSPASKLGLEAVARFCARAFDLPDHHHPPQHVHGRARVVPRDAHRCRARRSTHHRSVRSEPAQPDPRRRHGVAARGIARRREHDRMHHELVRRRSHDRAGVGAVGVGVVGSAGNARDPRGAVQSDRSVGRPDPASIDHRPVSHELPGVVPRRCTTP